MDWRAVYQTNAPRCPGLQISRYLLLLNESFGCRKCSLRCDKRLAEEPFLAPQSLPLNKTYLHWCQMPIIYQPKFNKISNVAAPRYLTHKMCLPYSIEMKWNKFFKIFAITLLFLLHYYISDIFELSHSNKCELNRKLMSFPIVGHKLATLSLSLSLSLSL